MSSKIPKPFPGENLYGLLGRAALLDGNFNHLKTFRDAFGVSGGSIANATLDLKTTTSRGFESQTFSRLCAQLGMPSQGDGYCTNNVVPSTLITLSFGTNGVWRFCDECVEVDKREYSVAYWHLAHQLPTQLICHIHHTSLSEVRVMKKLTHEHLWRIDEVSRCAVKNEYDEERYLKGLATLGVDAINDRSEPLDALLIQETLLATMRRLKFITNVNTPNNEIVHQEFLAKYGARVLSLIEKKIEIKNLTQVIIKDVLEKSQSRLLLRLLLIDLLYGSWALFKSHCYWTANFFQEGLINNVHSGSGEVEFTQLMNQHYKVLNYFIDTSGANRSMFLKLHYSTFRWFIRHDKKLLDRKLPLSRAIKQFDLF
jgi:TniQ